MASTTATWYRGTNQTSSGTYFGTVGYDGSPIVGRFAFTTPATGATSFSFTTETYYCIDDGYYEPSLHFAISTSSTAYINKASSEGYAAGGNFWDYPGAMNSDGSKSVQLLPNTTYYLWIFPATSNYGRWKITSVSVTLSGAYGNPATPSASNGNFGASVGITLSGGSSGATYTVTASCAGKTETLQTKGTGTYLSWKPALASYGPLLPNKTSATATITVETFYGSTSRGTKQTSITLSFRSADASPTVSSGWYIHVPYNASAGSGINKYIQGISRARFSFDSSKISTKYGATVSSYSVTVGSTTDSASPYETPVLNGATTVTVKVTDSRGFSYSTSITITPLSYAAPTLGQVSIFRCNQSGAADEDGMYYSVKATAVYSSLDGANSASILRYQKTANGSYGSGTAYTSGATVIAGPIDADTVYEVKLEIKDAVGSSGAVTQRIPSRTWAMRFRPNGQGVAFGMSPQADRRLEIPSDWGIYIGEEKLVVESGDGYCKLPGGTLLCWGRTDTIELSGLTPRRGNGYTYYEAAQNISFPVAFVAKPYLLISKSVGSIAAIVWYSWTAEKITEIDFATIGEATSTKVSADWVAIGRWK